MDTTGDPVPSGHRDGPDHHFIGQSRYRWTTSPDRAGTGEMVHRLPVHRLVGSTYDKHEEDT